MLILHLIYPQPTSCVKRCVILHVNNDNKKKSWGAKYIKASLIIYCGKSNLSD